jgi:hypothetical protein
MIRKSLNTLVYICDGKLLVLGWRGGALGIGHDEMGHYGVGGGGGGRWGCHATELWTHAGAAWPLTSV